MVEKCWACAYKKDKTHKEKSKSPKRAKIAHVNLGKLIEALAPYPLKLILHHINTFRAETCEL